jgi:restriction system protein
MAGSAHRNGEFMRKVFEILWDKPEGMIVNEILETIKRTIPLSEYELGYYSSDPNYPRFTKLVRFASIPLSKAQWIVKSKGKWMITDAGKEAYRRFKNPEEFYKEAYRLYYEWKKSRPTTEAIDEYDEETTSTTLTFEEAEENAITFIRQYLEGFSGHEFQDLVADLLKAMGYHVVWVAPPGKDRGVDIIAYTDPLGTSAPRIKVQVKHKSTTPTPVGELRSFLSTLGIDDIGIFVSTGGFTPDSSEEARTQETRKVTLINFDTFLDLWIEYYSRLTHDARQRLPLKPIYYLAPKE